MACCTCATRPAPGASPGSGTRPRQAALNALEELLDSRPAGAFTLKLQPGMGLICNNVLHTRAGFTDRPEHRRLLYRARYHDPLRNLRV
jgi:alpha-ketoglutarate-dependent taurine dioxygenase